MWWFVKKIDHSEFFTKIVRFMLFAHDIGDPFFQKLNRYPSKIVLNTLLLITIFSFTIAWIITLESPLLASIIFLIGWGFLFFLAWNFLWGFIEDFYFFWFHWEFVANFRAFIQLYILCGKKYKFSEIEKEQVLAAALSSEDFQKIKLYYLDILQVLKNYPQVTASLSKSAVETLINMKKKLIKGELTNFDIGCINGAIFTIEIDVRKLGHYNR